VPRLPKFCFYLDENFPAPAGRFLKSLGHQTVRGINVLGKTGLSDHKHLQESIRRKAILLAFDRDFIINPDLRTWARRSKGVILIEASDTSPETAERVLRKVLKSLARNSVEGKICRASVDKISFLD